MSKQPGSQKPTEITQAAARVRRLREPVAWTLLAITAVIVVVSACQLFNLAGAKVPVASPVRAVSRVRSVPVRPGLTPVPVSPGQTPGPAGLSLTPAPAGPARAPASAFSLRAAAVAPQFIDAAVQGLPVLAVVLVVFSGGRTGRAGAVARTAAVVLAAAFALGLISLGAAAGAQVRPGAWFILEWAGLAITATALIFTSAVLRSLPFRPPAPLARGRAER